MLAVFLWLAFPHGANGAETADWSEILASRFSRSWQEAGREKWQLRSRLSKLPEISASDFGGPAGYLSDRISGSFVAPYEHKWLQVRWKRPEKVDLVALVPARQFDEYGLDPQYGLPEDFRVLLLDDQGNTLRILADERDTGQDPVRRGHPFLYSVDPPVRCSGLRIESTRSHRHPSRQGNWQFVAWGEIYCFNGARNVFPPFSERHPGSIQRDAHAVDSGVGETTDSDRAVNHLLQAWQWEVRPPADMRPTGVVTNHERVGLRTYQQAYRDLQIARME